MNMTWSRAGKFATIVGLIVLGGAAVFSVNGQSVRLRSRVTPVCSSNSPLKFADIYADGNIAVQGSYACRGAFIYDISNPDRPVLASWYNPGGNIQFLEAIVIGNRGYFGSGNGAGVHIVDLTNPYDPKLLGVVSSGNGGFVMIHEMVVFDQGGQRYLIENYNSFSRKVLKVLNVTDPAQPFLVREIDPTEPIWIHAFHIRGDRMFTSGWGNSTLRGRTEIYDISNLAGRQPTLIGYVEDPSSTVTAGNNMHSTWSSEDGNYLYSARETGDGTGDIRVYDIRDAARPALGNRLTMQELGLNAITPHNPVVMGSKLYVSWYQAGIQVFDISTPSSPHRVGQYDTFQPEYEVNSRTALSLSSSDPWDLICGSEALQNALPSNYDGAWAVFPFLGTDKVLAGDLRDGLLVLDATGVGLPAKNRISDFDGDGRTDLAVYSPSSGSWMSESSRDHTVTAATWGIDGDLPVPADYDGDGVTDQAVFRPSNSTWYIRGSREGIRIVPFGTNGDLPVPADFDADGQTDIAVWRPTTGTWFLLQSTVGFRIQPWGEAADVPVAGDFEGDGKADLMVWRPTNGKWYLLTSSSTTQIITSWGENGDRPVRGDFTGDGRDDLAVYRPSTGFWYILDTTRNSVQTYQFGIEGDLPMPSDFDGDGRADVAVFRSTDNIWFRLNSSDGGFSGISFGSSGDIPTPVSSQPR